VAERRAWGEGSIYRLPNGRWQGSVGLGWVNGRRVRRRITRETRREVATDLRELIGKAELGQLRTERPPTLATWLDTYVAEVSPAVSARAPW
jgi:hypothetical protein